VGGYVTSSLMSHGLGTGLRVWDWELSMLYMYTVMQPRLAWLEIITIGIVRVSLEVHSAQGGQKGNLRYEEATIVE